VENVANPNCGEKMKTSTKDNTGNSVTFNETFNFQKTENMDLLTVSRATITTHNTLVKQIDETQVLQLFQSKTPT
jgi:hypothetical protein